MPFLFNECQKHGPNVEKNSVWIHNSKIQETFTDLGVMVTEREKFFKPLISHVKEIPGLHILNPSEL